MFKLQITRYENNDRYEAELADYKDRRRFGNCRIDNSDYPQKEISKNAMEVFITEEQFEAIRKSVLEVF
jgi:hypothetical protein